MPTYQYRCTACGHEMEEFQTISEKPLVRCPKCNTENLARIIGAGAGVIFKGTGFHLTDYRKASKPAGEKESKSAKKEDTKGPSETGGKTDSTKKE